MNDTELVLNTFHSEFDTFSFRGRELYKIIELITEMKTKLGLTELGPNKFKKLTHAQIEQLKEVCLIPVIINSNT